MILKEFVQFSRVHTKTQPLAIRLHKLTAGARTRVCAPFHICSQLAHTAIPH